jgi:hypothetical protein
MKSISITSSLIKKLSKIIRTAVVEARHIEIGKAGEDLGTIRMETDRQTNKNTVRIIIPYHPKV